MITISYVIVLIISSLYFMLPAYLANMTPLLVRKVNFLDYPVDLKKKFNGERILGSHKTFRGFFFGTLAGIITAYLQYSLQQYAFFSGISLVDYSGWFIVGFLLGFGALIGDLVKSFFKRRFHVKPGKPFIPWDQLDYSIGSLLFISLVYVPSINVIAVIIMINLILHIAANHIGYYLGINDVKW